jgi:hypothetical protein
MHENWRGLSGVNYLFSMEDVQTAVIARLEEAQNKLKDHHQFDDVALGRIEFLINDMDHALDEPDSVMILFPENKPPYPAKRTTAEVAQQLENVLSRIHESAPSGFLLGRLDILSVAILRVLADPEQVRDQLGSRA